MNQTEVELQRLRAELEKTNEILAVRTGLLGRAILSAVWKHNIQGYASTIRNVAILLRHNLRVKSSESILRYLSIIEEEAKSIIEYPTVPLLTSKEGLELVCINDLLRICDQIIGSDPDGYDVKLNLRLGTGDQTFVLVNRWWMGQVLRIIIENGMKAMSKSAEKVMTITSSAKDGGPVEIVLRDTGCGIPEGIKPMIFKEPIPKSHEQPGLGIGLLIAMTIIQVYKGSIRLLNTDSNGTTLAILLPQSSES